MKISFPLSSLCDLIPSLNQKNPEEIGEIFTNLGMETESITEYNGLKKLSVAQVSEIDLNNNLYHISLRFRHLSKMISLSSSFSLPLGSYVLYSEDTSKEIRELGILHPNFETKSDCFLSSFESEIIANETKSFLEQKDFVICVDVPANRPDLLSIVGAANSLSLYLDSPIIPDETTYFMRFSSERIIQINTKNCSRYFLSEIKIKNGINLSKIRRYLQILNINCISPFVDLSNWTMIFCGQPTHLFDAQKIEGSISIREANAGENIILLDGSEIVLESEDIVISDTKKIIALAGIMGCKNSAVDPKSNHVLLESAHFNRKSIQKTSERLQIKTDASMRFEKNVPPTGVEFALKHFCTTLENICPSAQISHPIKKEIEIIEKNNRISISQNYIRKYLGCNDISNKFIEKIVKSFGTITKNLEDLIEVNINTDRSDLLIPEDIIEEVARFYGYNKIPVNYYRPSTPQNIYKKNIQEEISDLLRGLGLSEAITMVFRSEEMLKKYAIFKNSIPLNNPLTREWSHLRPFLFDGLCETVKFNISKAFVHKIALSEIGSVFYKKNDELCENLSLSMILFDEDKDPYPKGLNIFYNILKYLRCDNVSLRSAKNLEFLHPHNSFEIFLETKSLGFFGQLHPKIAYDLKLSEKEDFSMPVIGEIDLTTLKKEDRGEELLKIKIPDTPPIFREITLSVDKNILGFSIIREIKDSSPVPIIDIRYLSTYQNEKLLSKNKYNISLKIRFNPEKSGDKENIDKYILSLLEIYQ